MTPLSDDVDFNAPFDHQRAGALIESLRDVGAADVVDIGCGWGELLLRTLAAHSGATGTGIDRSDSAIGHARALAATRGLDDRVGFEVADATTWSPPGPVDVVLNIGSTHVWGGDPVEHTARALTRTRQLLRPGGRLLFGECFWERTPSSSALAAMDIPVDQYRSLVDLVDLTAAHGFELLNLGQASLEEWDSFESRHALGYIRYLQNFPDADDAQEIREKHRAHRTFWLRGTRSTLGFGYLTLLAV